VALHAGKGAGGIRVTYRAGSGAVVDTTLDRLCADEVIAGLPVREFRWYKGRRHYSGWYWCATGRRLVVYESRLELALNRTLHSVINRQLFTFGAHAACRWWNLEFIGARARRESRRRAGS